MKRNAGWAAGVGAMLVSAGCGSHVPPDAGPLPGGGLRPCPTTANCVHTGHGHPPGTEPFQLSASRRSQPVGALLDEVAAALETLPRTVVVDRRASYLRAESTSLIFRFVDDVEVVVQVGQDRREVVVRSASRVGRSDLGVNPRRVRALRRALELQGVI